MPGRKLFPEGTGARNLEFAPVRACRNAGAFKKAAKKKDDRVDDNLNPVGRLYYAASTTLCCAHSLSEEVGTALGAQAGEQRLAEVFRKAGFRKFRRAKATPFNLIFEAKS